ncbi:hypothetical protein A2U01_0075215, partial [Trifolium medium]|nr:hypothetical protein [Trifolium medium]
SGICDAHSLCCAARNAVCSVTVLFLAAAPRAGVTCAARSIVADCPVLFWFMGREQGVAAPRADPFG